MEREQTPKDGRGNIMNQGRRTDTDTLFSTEKKIKTILSYMNVPYKQGPPSISINFYLFGQFHVSSQPVFFLPFFEYFYLRMCITHVPLGK